MLTQPVLSVQAHQHVRVGTLEVTDSKGVDQCADSYLVSGAERASVFKCSVGGKYLFLHKTLAWWCVHSHCAGGQIKDWTVAFQKVCKGGNVIVIYFL